MASRAKIATPRERVEEALREVGVLFIALAPLDTVFSQDVGAATPSLLLFLAAGVTLFGIALSLEKRRRV